MAVYWIIFTPPFPASAGQQHKSQKSMKKFKILCSFGAGKIPFDLCIGEPEESNHPLRFQAMWLSREQGGTISLEVMDSFAKLHKIACENNVSFEELCMDALGSASKEDMATTDSPVPESDLPETPEPQQPASPQPPLDPWDTKAMGDAGHSDDLQISDELLAQEAVILVKGENMFCHPTYSYLKFPMRNFRKLRDAMAAGENFKPSDYGEVIAAGRGEPSQELRDEMRVQYGLVDTPKPEDPGDEPEGLAKPERGPKFPVVGSRPGESPQK